MRRFTAVARVALAAAVIALVSSCGDGNDSDPVADENFDPATSAPTDTTTSDEHFDPATSTPTDATSSSVAELPSSTTSFGLGNIEFRSLSIGDAVVEVAIAEPRGTIPNEPEVVFTLPPGGQDHDTTEDVMAQIWARGARERGWVVVSPVAPDGLFFTSADDVLPGLVDWAIAEYHPRGDKLHLAGVSNGGLSAFHAFALTPDRFDSVTVFPGYARDDDRDALDALAQIPVRLFVGGEDSSWLAASEDLRDELDQRGGDVVLRVFPGEGHRIGALRDGTILFDTIAAASGAA